MFRPLTLLLFLTISNTPAFAQRLEIPRRHEKPPGPPVTAEEAVKRMTVPEGFSVEIVANEPDVVNPVGMFIDEKGRFWITESLEYPRREPGPGRDRVKVLEDTDGDGKVDKTTVFAEGLNIPSGIAVGHGGVWVANSPDILFMQDTDGDLKADKIEKVVTGFGRTDTHELPNSLTWGPDGWLYGLNGVFNYSDVKYAAENPNYDPKHPGWSFTCALFRIHPRTREFQIFAEGTSNPWGIAINGDGEFFISACVIDHLWHIVETAYYIRQGGPYPPNTWPMRSIVNYTHQKAAYCGITWFDSPAYPEEYRNVLYFGNIHGGCINADIADPSGSTYKGRPHPGFPAQQGAFENEAVAKIGEGRDAKLADFLTANDAWFMPVVQKVGPDGCLYILDWYDRYHCYQDANADPEGIEREMGRLYRVVYKGHKNTKAADLSQKSDDELIALLGDPNIYNRETAQRLLQERSHDETSKKLLDMVLAAKGELNTQQRHALWTLLGSELDRTDPDQRASELGVKLSQHADAFAQRWGIRLQTSQRMKLFQRSDPEELQASEHALAAMESDNPFVRAQGVTFATRLIQQQAPYVNFVDALVQALGDDIADEHLSHLIWIAFDAMLDREQSAGSQILQSFAKQEKLDAKQISLFERVGQRILENPETEVAEFQKTLELLMSGLNGAAPIEVQRIRSQTIRWLVDSIINGVVRDHKLTAADAAVKSARLKEAQKLDEKSSLEQLGLKVVLKHPGAADELAKSSNLGNRDVARAITALAFAQDDLAVKVAREQLNSKAGSPQTKSDIVQALRYYDNDAVGTLLLATWDQLPPETQPVVLNVMTQRPRWAGQLLAAIAAQQISKDALNLNQLRQIANFKNEDVQAAFGKIYGAIREGRNPDREQVYWKMRDFLGGTPGDPQRGVAVFNKVCAQCHKMYGEGAEVGPDITRNGRNNWDQLLQNVFDPSAVIGPGYQARIVATDEGRVLTGLAVEENEDRVVLKVQGGKLETIPRDKIEVYKVSEVSMMPEDLEKQLMPQELADLFAYLALDRPPSDPEAKVLSGAPQQKARKE